MEIANATRLSPMVVPSADKEGRPQWVVIVKGTFSIAHGHTADFDPEPEPFVLEDRFLGAPYASSLLREDDLAPFKPRADVCFDSIAHAPGGKASRGWNVRVRVGALEKSLRVTGPRAWVRSMLRYELSEPQACETVPVRYERAYGGPALEENPAGAGHKPEKKDVVLAPQIERIGEPLGAIDRSYAVEGLGPIAKPWMPRRAHVGTTDERWQRDRAPRLPADFDYAFYNSARPDLTAPYLRGDESVSLEGIDPEPLAFRLPGVRPKIRVRPAMEVPPLELDTLLIDTNARKIVLTWRCMFFAEHELDALSVR